MMEPVQARNVWSIGLGGCVADCPAEHEALDDGEVFQAVEPKGGSSLAQRADRSWRHSVRGRTGPRSRDARIRSDQLMWMPEMARLMTSRCTSDVPSKMV